MEGNPLADSGGDCEGEPAAGMAYVRRSKGQSPSDRVLPIPGLCGRNLSWRRVLIHHTVLCHTNTHTPLGAFGGVSTVRAAGNGIRTSSGDSGPFWGQNRNRFTLRARTRFRFLGGLVRQN